MRAFVVTDFDQPGQVIEIPDAVPGEGEVLVRVHTASINPMDAVVVKGGTRAWAETRLPLIPGIDAAGTVEAVAPGVEGFKIGDSVIANAGTKPFWGEGTFAELVAVTASAVVLKPSDLNDVDAATISLAGLTALAALDALDPAQGQVVVVTGATGGVGSWFIQIAADRGATVVALTRPETAEYARKLGATETVDYSTDDPIEKVRAMFPDGVDALADFSGNTELIESLSALVKRGGRLASSGAMLDAEAYSARGLTASQANRAALDRTSELLDLIAAGRIKAPPATVVPLEDAGKAVSGVGEKHTRGKIVIRIS